MRGEVVYGNGREDDSRAIRLLFNGFSVLDARLEVDIWADEPPRDEHGQPYPDGGVFMVVDMFVVHSWFPN
jgi:hypothetical protein